MTVPDPDSGPSSAPVPPVGERTASMLLATFQHAYHGEIGTEEDIHRTLPFFATALGLVIAAVNYALGQLPGWDMVVRACPRGQGMLLQHHMLACIWPVLVATGLLVASAGLGVGVLAYLAAATRRRGYKRIGREPEQLARARDLLAYHAARGLQGAGLDDAVHLDLREQLLDDLAEAVTFNRDITLSRYALRARAVAFLLASLLSALIATILILMTAKTGLLFRTG